MMLHSCFIENVHCTTTDTNHHDFTYAADERGHQMARQHDADDAAQRLGASNLCYHRAFQCSPIHLGSADCKLASTARGHT